MLSTPTRLREWLAFLGAAAPPALAMGALALSALRGEEAAVREQMRLRLEQAATSTETRFQQRLEELRGGRGWDEVPWADRVALPAEARKPDLPGSPPICRKLAGALRRGEPGTREKILERCPTHRNEAGRMLWPLAALGSGAGTEASRIDRWIGEHAGALRPAERAATRREIQRAGWLAPADREHLAASLGGLGEATATQIAAQHRSPEARIDWADRRTTGQLRRRDDGGYHGFVVHRGSLARAAAAGWPNLPDGSSGELVLGASPPEGPSATLLPDGAHLSLGWADRDAVASKTARSGQLLIGAAALATAIAIGLAALLFRRMRAARRLSALRTDFVAAVSHELRTPIASLRMLSELLAEGRADPAERAEMHQALARESHRLGDTVNRLLGFSRMEAGKRTAKRERARLEPVLAEAVETFGARHPEASVALSVPSDLEASLDAEAVRMAVGNLLENARKYGAEPYEVSAKRTGGAVEIAVRDHGPGIARRDQKRIFRPFERAADRLSEATEGSGIGLSLVGHVARSHGGRARVDSEPGRGATFTLSIVEP